MEFEFSEVYSKIYKKENSCLKDYYLNNKSYTVISLRNRTTIAVQETPDEIFEQIKA